MRTRPAILRPILFAILVLACRPGDLAAQEFDSVRAAVVPAPTRPDSLSELPSREPGLGLVSYRDGLLARHPALGEDWLDAPLRSQVIEGDRVRTGAQGRAEIEFDERNVVRLAPSTTLRLDKLAQETRDAALQVDVQLEQGELWAELEGLEEEDEFSVGSQVMGAAITGTGFRLAVDPDGTTLSVLHGEVRVAASREALRQARPTVDVDSLAALLTSPPPAVPVDGRPHPVGGPVPVAGPREVSLEEWLVIVKGQQQIRIGADGRIRAAGALPAAGSDAWTRFNEERNSLRPVDRP